MYQAYLDHFVANGFYLKLVQPCRLTKTGSLIDPSCCKLSEYTSKLCSGILIIRYMSVHLPRFTVLDIISNQDKPPNI